MRSNTIISQLTNENHMIKVKYNELYEHCKGLEKKIAELESAKGHIENPLCPCSRPPCPTPVPVPVPTTESYGTIDYNAIILSLEQKILELNKQIIEQNKHIR